MGPCHGVRDGASHTGGAGWINSRSTAASSEHPRAREPRRDTTVDPTRESAGHPAWRNGLV